MIIDGWLVLRFTYDDICDKPRLCQQILQQFMGAMLGEDNSVDEATFLEKEIVRHAKRLCRPITPDDVCHHFNIENKYARRLLLSLTEKHWMKPASGTIRVRSYELDLDGKSYSF